MVAEAGQLGLWFSQAPAFMVEVIDGSFSLRLRRYEKPAILRIARFGMIRLFGRYIAGHQSWRKGFVRVQLVRRINEVILAASILDSFFQDLLPAIQPAMLCTPVLMLDVL